MSVGWTSGGLLNRCIIAPHLAAIGADNELTGVRHPDQHKRAAVDRFEALLRAADVQPVPAGAPPLWPKCDTCDGHGLIGAAQATTSVIFEFPGKKIFGNSSPEFIATRRAQLQAWRAMMGGR